MWTVSTWISLKKLVREDVHTRIVQLQIENGYLELIA